MSHDEEHEVPVRESDFAFCRVNVDVELHVGHVEEQYRNGFALRSVWLVSLRYRLAHHLVLDGAVPHEEELVVALAVCLRGGGDEAGDVDARFGIIDGQ